MKRNNFDKVAGIYDQLAGLVFGSSIRDAQLCFLSKIKPHSKVLILGGGTGWILNELDKLDTPLETHYVEASAKMLRLAENRKPFNHLQMHYILGTEDSIPQQKYDLVITNFFLDIFNKNSLSQVMYKIAQHLSDDALWICTDFVKGAGLWQNSLIRLMYGFFKLTTNLEGSRLQDFSSHFIRIGYASMHKKHFFHNMIEAGVYTKI